MVLIVHRRHASQVLKCQKKKRRTIKVEPHRNFFARVSVTFLRRDLGVDPSVAIALLRWLASATSDDLDANEAHEKKRNKKNLFMWCDFYTCFIQTLAFRLQRDRKDCDRRLLQPHVATGCECSCH